MQYTHSVQRDDQQRQLEAHAEDDEQVDHEAEVLIARQRGHLDIVADGQQEVESLRNDEVCQHSAGHEEHRGCRHERDRVLAFLLQQTGSDELPDLVEPHRAREHDARGQCDLEAQHELIEWPCRQEAAGVVRGQGRAG